MLRAAAAARSASRRCRRLVPPSSNPRPWRRLRRLVLTPTPTPTPTAAMAIVPLARPRAHPRAWLEVRLVLISQGLVVWANSACRFSSLVERARPQSQRMRGAAGGRGRGSRPGRWSGKRAVLMPIQRWPRFPPTRRAQFLELTLPLVGWSSCHRTRQNTELLLSGRRNRNRGGVCVFVDFRRKYHTTPHPLQPCIRGVVLAETCQDVRLPLPDPTPRAPPIPPIPAYKHFLQPPHLHLIMPPCPLLSSAPTAVAGPLMPRQAFIE